MNFLRILLRSKNTTSLTIRKTVKKARFTTYIACYSNRIQSISLERQQMLQVSWKDQQSCDFPHIFLRDNCQCSQCFDSSTLQRTVETIKEIPLDVKPKDVNFDQEKNNIVVTWPDNHTSMYSGDWLKERKFPERNEDLKPTTLYGLEQKPWSITQMKKTLPTVDYEEFLTDDLKLLEHTENLIEHGISRLSSAPVDKERYEVLKEIGSRMAVNYVKSNHYGDFWEVRSKASPSNLAYTSHHLPLHTDLPFYVYQPVIQLLHCVEQSAGKGAGTSIFSDGLKAALTLKERNPEYFKMLCDINFRFNDIGTDQYGDFNMQHERPIISLDKFGNVAGNRYNNHVRSSWINLPSEEVLKSYNAYYALANILNEDDAMLYYKMVPGDVLVFNNTRILHGRTAFDAKTTTRWLQGCYFDWDEVHSKYRVVRSRLDPSMRSFGRYKA